jgi:hypothetical protein
MQKSQNNKIPSLPSLPVAKTKSHKFRSWFSGILFLAGVVAAVTHLGKIEHFARLAEQAKPKWLLVVLLFRGRHLPLHCGGVVPDSTLRASALLVVVT